MIVLSETKSNGKGEWYFGNLIGRMSGVSSGRDKEVVCIIVGEAWKGCVREWKEVSSRLMYVLMKVGMDKYVIVEPRDRDLKGRKRNVRISGLIWVR